MIDLSYAALDVTPVNFDWSDGYGETWEAYEAPECPTCYDYAGWDADEHSWVCDNQECGGYREEIDESDHLDGPIMSYYYPLPDTREYGPADAEKIAHLPLCIVCFAGHDYALALTGGGMDLTWEIAEAFMALGFLPPYHFTDLPRMAGRGTNERDQAIIAACEQTLDALRSRIQSRQTSLDHMRNRAGMPS